jgi:hypothetical protein
MATAFGEPLAPKQRQKTSVECEHCKKNGKAAMFHQPKSCQTLHPGLKRRPKVPRRAESSQQSRAESSQQSRAENIAKYPNILN